MTAIHELPAYLASDEKLRTFLQQFRAGTLPKHVFNHAGHVTVAVCYCRELDERECLDRVRQDICCFNVAVGGQNTEDAGYHETLTVFWLNAVRAFLGAQRPDLHLLEAARAAVTEFGPKRDMFKRYYSFDVVQSREARVRYVPPDITTTGVRGNANFLPN